MYGEVRVRDAHSYRVEFCLHLASATSYDKRGIVLPACSEFHGCLDAPVLRFKVDSNSKSAPAGTR